MCNGAGKWYWASNVLYVYYTEDPDGAVSIESTIRFALRIENKDYITIQDLELKHGITNAGIGNGGSDYIILDSLTASYGYRYNVEVAGSEGQLTNITIKNSDLSYAGGSGICVNGNVDLCLIQNNTIYYNCQMKDSEVGQHIDSAGIAASSNNCTNLIVENNTIYNNGIDSLGTLDQEGRGFWADENVDAPIIRYNNIYGNKKDGIFIEISSNAQIYYNLVHSHSGANPGTGIFVHGRATPASGNIIYNNVCYDNGYEGIAIWGDGINADCCNNNLVKNNICMNSGSNELEAKGGGENDGTYGSGNVYSNNCFDAEASNFIVWGTGNNISTYDDWETAYGGTTSSVESDPLMTDPGSDDFTLQFGSPCINKGAHVGLFLDYTGTMPVPIGHQPDIGAYEHKNGGVIWESFIDWILEKDRSLK